MKNKISNGKTFTFTNPGGALAAGAGIQSGGRFGICVSDVANGAVGVAERGPGVYAIAMAAVNITIGTLAYWDDTAKLITNVSTSNRVVGFFDAAASSGDATVDTYLTGNTRNAD